MKGIRIAILLPLFFLPLISSGQLTIAPGTSLAFGSNTTFTTSVSGYRNNGARVTIPNLIVNGGGDKTLSGEWEISNSLNILNGILVPGGSGKIVFSGSSLYVGSGAFVSGQFFSRGSGHRDFPIGYKVGNTATYTPVSFTSVPSSNEAEEIGVLVVLGDPQLVPTPDLEAVLSTHHWTVTSNSPVDSPVRLSLNGFADRPAGLVVVQGSNAGDAAINLLTSSVSEESVTSLHPATQTLLAIGVGKEYNVKVHDLITPFKADEVNDRLYIENIELTTSNTVTLLDRWGVVQKEWKDYQNDDPQFDFSKLSPGNYICVVEYQVAGLTKKSKVSQMVTVLKAN